MDLHIYPSPTSTDHPMSLLKISNCYLTMGRITHIAISVTTLGYRSTHPTKVAFLTTCASRGLGCPRFSCYQKLLQVHETRFNDTALRGESVYPSNSMEALRVELYLTKLKLLATQLSYKELAFSVATCSGPGPPNTTLNLSSKSIRCVSPTTLCLNQGDCSDVFQPMAELQNVQKAVPSQLLDNPSILSPDSRQIDSKAERGTSTSQPEEGGLDEVRQLIATARDGAASLSKVLWHKQIAEDTPKGERTVAQKFLIDKWMAPRLRELFVDASGQGIGVVMDDRWLAWKFVIDNSDLPKSANGIVNTPWAELIAVEMGVRTLIAAKYSYMPVTLRCDNTGVVEALKAQKWKNKLLDDVVQRIFALCEEGGLYIMPDNVRKKENPADGPSKGVFPSWDLSFAFRPSIPTHLSELIQDVELPRNKNGTKNGKKED